MEGVGVQGRKTKQVCAFRVRVGFQTKNNLKLGGGVAGGSLILKKHTGSLMLYHQMFPFTEGCPGCLLCVTVSVHACVCPALWGVCLKAIGGKGSGRETRISRIVNQG